MQFYLAALSPVEIVTLSVLAIIVIVLFGVLGSLRAIRSKLTPDALPAPNQGGGGNIDADAETVAAITAAIACVLESESGVKASNAPASGFVVRSIRKVNY